jgi:hypothetical protein
MHNCIFCGKYCEHCMDGACSCMCIDLDDSIFGSLQCAPAAATVGHPACLPDRSERVRARIPALSEG